MHHLTTQRLLGFTDHIEFERMVLDVLSYLEFPGIDPQSPTIADGGKDGLYYYSDKTCAWFAFSLQKSWKTKYKKDYEKALKSGQSIKTFVFCTSRDLPVLERDKRKQNAMVKNGVAVDFWDGERLRVALDTVCKDVRQTYLGISDNSGTRRQLRYILLDPENEVPAASLWRLESAVPSVRGARGCFQLLKTADLSTVAETNAEMKALAGLLEAYFKFRMFASQLESHTVTLVGQKLKNNHFVSYWHVLAGYCMHRAAGIAEAEALRIAQIQNISGVESGCLAMYPEVIADLQFKRLLAPALISAQKCDKSLTVAKGVKSLLEQPIMQTSTP
jgi:hypothetical protein